jgi:hypothetical protein
MDKNIILLRASKIKMIIRETKDKVGLPRQGRYIKESTGIMDKVTRRVLWEYKEEWRIVHHRMPHSREASVNDEDELALES